MPVDLIPPRVRKWAMVVAVFVDTAVFSLAIAFGYFLIVCYRARFVFDCGILEAFERSEGLFRAYAQLWWLPLVVAPLGFYFNGLYRPDPYRFMVRSFEQTFIGCFANVVMLMGITYVFRASITDLRLFEDTGATQAELQQIVWGFSTKVLVLTVFCGTIFVAGWRFLANRLENRFLKYTGRRLKLLIVGRLCQGDIERLCQNHSPCYELSGWLESSYSPDSVENVPALPCLGTTEDAAHIINLHGIEEVLLVSEQLSREETMQMLDLAAENGIKAWMVSDIYGTMMSALTHKMRAGIPFFEVRPTTISGWTLVIKRLIDISAATIMLLVSVPFFILPACIAIVIDSKGFPVFSQYRVGQGGRIFRLYKLRTMVIDADVKGPALTEDHDPRITKVGRFLRLSSIDELPQLWNVLKGDMSLVGPRAVIPFVADRFEDWERTSLDVKPGLTGLAQISGRDEIGFREKSLLNVYYVRNYSLWLDLRIVLATIRVVLSMEGTEGTRRDD